jgi:group II intron reverse transcriptase/maturase
MGDPHRDLEHLRKLAQANPKMRFNKLYKLIKRESFLEMVWQKVQTNPGSRTPGIDGQTKDDIDVTVFQTLAHHLATRYYRPQPVRRTYIPKRGKPGKLRGLGIPTLRDRIVQAAVARVLEALYEPLFRPCSHGFRPGRNTIQALRHVAQAYRSGVTWIVEGDLENCFDSLPHAVILTCLRKRIKDERFIDLIRQMLQAGVMEDGRYGRTYSGAPQGGLCSPILMNIVMHEFDVWMEEHWQANAPIPTRVQPEYARLNQKVYRLRKQLQGRLPMGRQTIEGLRGKIAQAEAARQRVPSRTPQRTIRFCRYADDYLVIMGGYSKADAQRLKEAMATWLQEHLGLRQHPEKTRITHWRDRLRFLGYDLRGQRNLNGTRRLRLTIPPAAERDLKQRVKRLCGYTHIPATDLITSVNALLNGWTQYYRYASNATPRFGYLTGVAFWLTAHYLSRKHRRSIKRLMATHYGVDPRTKRRALYILRPNGKRQFLWNKPPQRQSIFKAQVAAHDTRPAATTSWASGRSYEQRLEQRAQHGQQCQHCGQTSPRLEVHHPHRLGKQVHRKRGPAPLIQSANAQQVKWLCPTCHVQHHHRDGSTQPRRSKDGTGEPDAARSCPSGSEGAGRRRAAEMR